MESDNDGRKEDQGRHRDMPSKTKRKESDNDTIIFAWENKRSRDANAERRENAGLESKADHFKNESEQSRDTCNDGTPSTDYNRGESSRAKSHVRMEFSRGKPRERIPNGRITWIESGDYARNTQLEIMRTQHNQDSLCHMRNQITTAVMKQEESHRSCWSVGSRLRQSKDQSQSWKGKPWTKSPQFLDVAVHANGLPTRRSWNTSLCSTLSQMDSYWCDTKGKTMDHYKEQG